MVMEKVTVGKREIFVGVHPEIGLVIYDENAQKGVDSGQGANWIRLFKLDTFATGMFIDSEVRPLLTSPSQQQIDEAHRSIDQYLSAQNRFGASIERRRTAGCYKCANEINSVDFSICTKCSWIRCKCGACGCGYRQYNETKLTSKTKSAEAIRREKEDAEFFALFPPRSE